MKICQAFHQEIAFEGEDCPLCTATQNRDAAVADLEETSDRLSARIVELLDQIEAYRAELRL